MFAKQWADAARKFQVRRRRALPLFHCFQPAGAARRCPPTAPARLTARIGEFIHPTSVLSSLLLQRPFSPAHALRPAPATSSGRPPSTTRRLWLLTTHAPYSQSKELIAVCEMACTCEILRGKLVRRRGGSTRRARRPKPSWGRPFGLTPDRHSASTDPPASLQLAPDPASCRTPRRSSKSPARRRRQRRTGRSCSATSACARRASPSSTSRTAAGPTRPKPTPPTAATARASRPSSRKRPARCVPPSL